ncbi:hypothetical protein RA268_28210, partial [Pseudomonas syringae pv. tagetis]
DVLFHRKPENNSWGVLNVREEFAIAHPDLVKRVLASYEKARIEALKDPTKLKAALVAATKLPDTVIERQLERTNLKASTSISAKEPPTLEITPNKRISIYSQESGSNNIP